MKWDWGQPISTREDFQHVTVYKAPGPIYTLSFMNREADGLLLVTVKMLAIIAALLVGPYLMTDVRTGLSRMGVPGFIPVLAGIALIAAPWVWAFHVGLVAREIVMDFAYDRVLVFRRGRPKIDRKLSTLKRITIADHPDVELERARRGPGKGPGPLEKQHCLMGWFGAGETGTEQVILMTRFEFPKIHSLFEVAQAMIWVRRRYESAPPSPSMKMSPFDDDARPAAAPGIKPPLD